MKRTLAFLTLLALFLPLAQPANAQNTNQCFPETGYCVGGRFLTFWQGQGGLPVFGFALGEQRKEQGSEGAFDVQWFERERFELHPEKQAPYDVLLGRLGDEMLRRQGRDWRSFPAGTPKDGCRFFDVTGHMICEPFLSYWRGHGLEFDGSAGTSENESLALFGYPLSEPMMEKNSSGFTVLTQWFERARFEYIPDNPDPYKVLLGRLGAEVYDPNGITGLRYHAVQKPGWPAALEVPEGFTVEEAASGVPAPRFMARDPRDGSLVYGSSVNGQVVRLSDTNGDRRYDRTQIVADGLTFVHSVVFAGDALYAAAEEQIVRLANFAADGKAQQITKIASLPTGARDLYGHRTRTIAYGSDGKLYVSVGSSCDVCDNEDPRRAAILRMNLDGSNEEIVASGLRNTVGFDWRPFTNQLWGVDMGRNNLGQTTPPDELNLIEQGKNYGWPFCYGNNVPNPEFNDPGRCAASTVPALALPAHWSPLGMVFADRPGFPPSYQGDAIIAFHGTARDQVGDALAGYNVSRIRFKNGQPVAVEDLVRGWNAGGKVWGRPAGLLWEPDGSLLISDDNGGRIFRLRYVGP